MSGLLRDLCGDEQGTTSIEYALIGTLIAVACMVAFQRFASVTNVLYTLVAAMSTAVM
jgi:Flp pilus assembly pilin Flp